MRQVSLVSLEVSGDELLVFFKRVGMLVILLKFIFVTSKTEAAEAALSYHAVIDV